MAGPPASSFSRGRCVYSQAAPRPGGPRPALCVYASSAAARTRSQSQRYESRRGRILVCRAAARSPASASVVIRSSEAFVGRPFGPRTRLAGKLAKPMAKRWSSSAQPRRRAAASDSQGRRTTRLVCHPQLFDLWEIVDAELCLDFYKLRFERLRSVGSGSRNARKMRPKFLPGGRSSRRQRLVTAGIACRALEGSSLAQAAAPASAGANGARAAAAAARRTHLKKAQPPASSSSTNSDR